jgi:hypothetical protein
MMNRHGVNFALILRCERQRASKDEGDSGENRA